MEEDLIADEGDFEEGNAIADQLQREIGVGDSPKDTPEKKIIPETDTPPAPAPEASKMEEQKTSPAEASPGVIDLDHEETKQEATADKGTIIEKMKQQNAKLKKEFAALKDKLEECIEKAKRGNKQMSEKSAPNEEEMTREQEIKGIEQKIAYYKKQIQAMKRQLEGSFNIDKIVALENEEKAKKKIIQELEGEKHSLLRIQKEQKKAMDVMINEKELKKKRDQLKDELRNKKNELKEKQNLLRKQEKQMKEQHESLITLEEKCRKLQTLVYEKKAGLSSASTEMKTEEDVKALEAEIKDLERMQMEEKKKYKQMITTQENKIKELSLQIETLNLELKQKDQECRLNTLKINELKRQLRMGATKPQADTVMTKQGAVSRDTNKYSKDVEQIKRDMKAEKDHSEDKPAETPVVPELSDALEESKKPEELKTEQFQPLSISKEPVPEMEKEKKESEIKEVPEVKKEPEPKKQAPELEPKKVEEQPQPAPSVFSKPNLGFGKKKK